MSFICFTLTNCSASYSTVIVISLFLLTLLFVSTLLVSTDASTITGLCSEYAHINQWINYSRLLNFVFLITDEKQKLGWQVEKIGEGMEL